MQKKEQGKNPPILTKEDWSVEDLLICMAKRIFLLVGHMQKIVSIHNRPILSIPFTLPACKSSHSTIIINIILCTDCVIIYIYIYIFFFLNIILRLLTKHILQLQNLKLKESIYRYFFFIIIYYFCSKSLSNFYTIFYIKKSLFYSCNTLPNNLNLISNLTLNNN